MNRSVRVHFYWGKVVRPLGFGLLCLYFLGHALLGDSNLRQFLELREQTALLRTELASLVEQRRILESKVRRLRPGQIDTDFLEEQARTDLGYVHKGEEVILLPPSSPLQDDSRCPTCLSPEL